MVEWLYEAGIGEARAALVEHGAIVEARIEREDDPRVGDVAPARLIRAIPQTDRALVRIEPSGLEALLKPAAKLSEGSVLRVAVTRAPIPERGNPKPAWVRLARDDEPDGAGPALRDRLDGSVRTLDAHEPDALEAAGWSEVLDMAATGLVPFVGGRLRLSITPAMSLFDIDGSLDPRTLSIAGAGAAARAIRLFGIGGSIGIDLPVNIKADRQAVADAIDAALPQPFERTAVNGFGFVQIVRRRPRASLPELLHGDPALAAALALLRRAERTPGAGVRTLVAAAPVIDRLAVRPGWQAALAHRTGAPVALRADRSLPISSGHVEIQQI